jgi:hypothetical protein
MNEVNTPIDPVLLVNLALILYDFVDEHREVAGITKNE